MASVGIVLTNIGAVLTNVRAILINIGANLINFEAVLFNVGVVLAKDVITILDYSGNEKLLECPFDIFFQHGAPF